jgi:hypothetical protein
MTAPGLTTAGTGPDLPGRVRAVFLARCAACHGPELSRPKGHFGYVTDLRRLADSPKLVVPSKPEESRLWRLVERDEMPPEGARTGAATAAEKEVIRDWIAAGAPAAGPSRAQAEPPPRNPLAETPPPLLTRLLRWLGKLHLIVIHFPIALLLSAAAAEACSLLRPPPGPQSPVRLCVLLGSAAAVCAAALGWLLADVAGDGVSDPPLLALHRWLGTAAAAWSVGLVLLSERDARRGRRGWSFRVALWLGAALVGSAAHLGGGLVHGDDFFAW